MKQVFLFSTFIAALTFGISAQTAKQAKPKPDLTVQRLRAAVNYLASDKLEGRRAGTPGAMTAAGYVAGEFARIGLQPGVSGVSANVNPDKPRKLSRNFLQQFPLNQLPTANAPKSAAENTGYNVVGILPGNDPVLKTEAIVVGAHYDHLGRGGQGSLAANSTEIHRGADDNASGVAVLLELARTFAAEKKLQRRTIVFIAFGGEEAGLLGSKFYVNNPSFPLDKTAAMINLDMIGRLKDNKLIVGGVGTASEWRTILAEKMPLAAGQTKVVLNERTGAATTTDNVAIVLAADGQPVVVKKPDAPLFDLQLNDDGFGPSDHASFYGKNIPVLFFFTGTHADYHQPSDVAEKINFDGLKQIMLYVAAVVRRVDANDRRPTFTVAKSFGAGEGRRGFNVSLGTIPSYSENAGDGLTLDGVREASPAARAGIKTGDKIVSLAGREIRNVSDYTVILSELKAEQEYDIEVLRGGERLRLKITPAARK